MGTAEDDYKESFGMDTPPEKSKREKALDHALDIRKFESFGSATGNRTRV
jgi:hypothetical protein